MGKQEHQWAHLGALKYDGIHHVHVFSESEVWIQGTLYGKKGIH